MDTSPQYRVLLAYGITGLPLAAMGLPLYVFLPTFYAGLPGIGLALAGGLILMARSIDVLTDPLIGHWYDRHPAAPGRRRLLMLGGMVLLLAGIVNLFIPPVPVSGAYLFGWSLATYTGWTLITVPYLAWGAELTRHYHARTAVTASREAFAIIGTVVMIGLPVITGHIDDLARAMRDATWLLVVLLPLAVFITLAGTPARARVNQAVGTANHWRALMRQPIMRRLSLAFFLNSMANAIPASLILLYVEEVLGANHAVPAFLAAYFLSGLIALPLWQRLARHLGKTRTWAMSMLLASIAFTCVLALDHGDTTWFLLICAITGTSLGIDMALPASIQADVAEHQQLATGNHQTGMLFGLWSMLTKLALAMAVGIAFPLLALSGFESGQAATPMQQTWLTLLYALLPVLIKLHATYLIWQLPLTESGLRHLRNSAPHSREEAYEIHPHARPTGNPVPDRRV